MRNVCGLSWITCPRLNQTKNGNNSLSDHFLFYRLWHITSFIHSSLDIIYGFRIDASKNRLWYSTIFNYILTFLYKSGMTSIIHHKYSESFFEIIPLSEFFIQSFSLIDYSYFIWFCNEKLCIYFWKRLVYQRLGLLPKKIRIFKGSNSEFTVFLKFCPCVLFSNAYNLLNR